MCDYSAESVRRRQALESDRLKVAHIGLHQTVGLVDPNTPKIAVCMIPGTKLIISGIPLEQRLKWGVGEVATATFVQGINRHSYRDGVVFDGKGKKHILFQDFPLDPNLQISVEFIPGTKSVPSKPAESAVQAAQQPRRRVRELIAATFAAMAALVGYSWT